MTLYDYYRSTACYRLRIALYLKKIPFESIEVHLLKDGGHQHSDDYLHINPQALVPSLNIDGRILTQSLAIIEFLDETQPLNPLLPEDPFVRAQLRALSLIIACDTHPLNNLRVLNQLKQQFQADEAQVSLWYHHWLKSGFDAFEAGLRGLQRSQPFCYGDSVSLADICLIPQVYNAKRFNFSLEKYPLIRQIDDHCLSLEAFQKASPESMT